MKKPIFNEKGTKMLIDSGWKKFDKQTNCISTGNVFANTQYSSYIRPWKETECNGRTFPEGHLMDFDMQTFRKYYIPKEINDLLTNKNRNESVILYMFYVTEDDWDDVFGWVVTSKEHKLLLSRVVRNYNKQTYVKRVSALQEILKYITTDYE